MSHITLNLECTRNLNDARAFFSYMEGYKYSPMVIFNLEGANAVLESLEGCHPRLLCENYLLAMQTTQMLEFHKKGIFDDNLMITLKINRDLWGITESNAASEDGVALEITEYLDEVYRGATLKEHELRDCSYRARAISYATTLVALSMKEPDSDDESEETLSFIHNFLVNTEDEQDEELSSMRDSIMNLLSVIHPGFNYVPQFQA